MNCSTMKNNVASCYRILFFFIGNMLVVNCATCNTPNVNPHSFIVNETQQPIEVRCESGYETTDNRYFTCQNQSQWNGTMPFCSETRNRPPVNLKAIIGGVLTPLVVFALIITIIILKRKRRFQKKSDSSSAIPRSRPTSGDHIYANTEVDNGGYYEILPVPSTTIIKVEDFYDYVNRRLADKESLETEFKRLNSDFQKSSRNTEKVENRCNTTYENIHSYDDNKVKLRSFPKQTVSDYINASIINGYGSVKIYIAAQAPLKNTLNDFLRMVWELDVKQIVMITSYEEERQGLCKKYWQDGSIRKFGHLEVSLTKEYIFPGYSIRELSVTKNEESRTIKQYHFTTWPEKGVPENTATLINVRNLMCSDTRSFEEPIVVHCSIGIGRTGTFIALDYLMDQAKIAKYVDVFECAENLGKQRINMIQTKEQYIYLHKILREALISMPSASVPSDGGSFYQELLQRETSATMYSTLQEALVY